MTDWRAVGVGFLVVLVAGVLALKVPGVGNAVPGLVGGFLAGYIAGVGIVRSVWHGLGGGAWHGLLVGALGGIILAVLLVLVGPLNGVGGVGAVILVVKIALVLALNGAIGGVGGGLITYSKNLIERFSNTLRCRGHPRI